MAEPDTVDPIPALPTGADLVYIGEGGANVVFGIETAASLGLPNAEEDSQPVRLTHDSLGPRNVLRLRKAVPNARPVQDAHRQFTALLAPLFRPEHLLPQTPVRVSAEVLHRANSDLRWLERKEGQGRPEKRHGVYLSDAAFGSVLPNVHFWEAQGNGITLELKPKWLTQSPNAPQGARRCRTCALQLMRRQQRPNGRQRAGFCPLGLASGLQSEIECALRTLDGVQVVLQREKKEGWLRLLRDVRECCTSGVIAMLRDAQAQLDPKGVLNESGPTEDMLLAMTVRDCSLFLKIPLNPPARCTFQAADLDLKMPDKFVYWRSTEQALISGGWYTCESEAAEDAGQSCFLQRMGEGSKREHEPG